MTSFEFENDDGDCFEVTCLMEIPPPPILSLKLGEKSFVI